MVCNIDSHRAANLPQSLCKILGIPTIPLSVNQNPLVQVDSAMKRIASHLSGPISSLGVIRILKNKQGEIRVEISLSRQSTSKIIIHVLSAPFKDVAKKTLKPAHEQAHVAFLCFHVKFQPDLSSLSAGEISQQPALSDNPVHTILFQITMQKSHYYKQAMCYHSDFHLVA